MPAISLNIATNGYSLYRWGGDAWVDYDIDVGSGSTWSRKATGVAPHLGGTAYYSCPGWTILETDQIRVTARGRSDGVTLSWSSIATTPVLGVTQVDAASWSFTSTVDSSYWEEPFFTSNTTVANIVYSSGTTIVDGAVAFAQFGALSSVAGIKLVPGAASIGGIGDLATSFTKIMTSTSAISGLGDTAFVPVKVVNGAVSLDAVSSFSVAILEGENALAWFFNGQQGTVARWGRDPVDRWKIES